MKKFKSSGLRSISLDTDRMQDAAEIFASRLARRHYGRRAYARTCNLESWSQDGNLGEFCAFIGYTTGAHETTGSNVRFTVYSS